MKIRQTQSTATNRKISTYLTMIVLVVMALAIVALFIAAYTYSTAINVTDQLTAGILAGIGLIAMTLSFFLLFQSRRSNLEMKIEAPKVMTTIECTAKECKNKTVREFQRGDYVFKELDQNCEKCSGKQMVTAIYKEVKEKEKTYAV
jgi:cytochrome c biogenesis protein CcdA